MREEVYFSVGTHEFYYGVVLFLVLSILLCKSVSIKVVFVLDLMRFVINLTQLSKSTNDQMF